MQMSGFEGREGRGHVLSSELTQRSRLIYDLSGTVRVICSQQCQPVEKNTHNGFHFLYIGSPDVRFVWFSKTIAQLWFVVRWLDNVCPVREIHGRNLPVFCTECACQ
uniref:Uncharacterized protein n=1 Tax=Anguilla anguilla TaxID=7936 RepID=A0A0E9R8U2_ANGAN